jgi:serine/threonine protein kinase
LSTAEQQKILDCGLVHFSPSHQPGDGTLVSTISDANIILGTVGHMAPEQATGKEVTPATDVFALACVMYEVLTGHGASQRTSAASTLLAIMNEQPSWWNDCLDWIPPDLVRWVSHCLDKDRAAGPYRHARP